MLRSRAVLLIFTFAFVEHSNLTPRGIMYNVFLISHEIFAAKRRFKQAVAYLYSNILNQWVHLHI